MERPAFDIAKILSALPHRYPFLLVDRVLEIVKGERIHAYKNVTFNEQFFQGHFPGNPVMPGVLQLEALAQAGALLAHETAPFDPAQKVILLLAFDEVRFRRVVSPGDRLDLHVTIDRQKGSFWRLAGQAKVALVGTPDHFTLSTPVTTEGRFPTPAGRRWAAEIATDVGPFVLELRQPS